MPVKLDYQRIVEEIQTAITSDALVPETTLNELAADYLVACEEANQRLRECSELLRKGLRGEAIQRCEIEPNLLDLVAALDFPERSSWCDWLRETERAVPPPLSLDVAADLNTAYAQEQPLASLMKRHRLLALARAPLRDRLAVLRQIAAADTANPIWSDDLRQYEQQRHKQLRADVDAAAKAGDAGALMALEKELRDAGWLERPAAGLLDRVIESATRLRAHQARAEMRQLEPELTAAFANFEVQRARTLRSRWKALQMLAALPPHDPLVELVAPVLEWLDEQDRRDEANAEYDQSLADLEAGLDDNLSRNDLDRLYHRLVGCDRGVPEVIEQRYRERMAALALAETRRNKLLFAGLGVSVVVAAAGVWLWIGHQLRETEVADAAQALHALLEEAKVTEAQQFLEGITHDRPWLNERAELAELHARLDGMLKAESDRKTAFATALKAAKDAGIDRPDPVPLEAARRLATTSKEKADVLKFERQIAQRQRELQDQRNTSFTARVDTLRQKIDEIETDTSEDFEKRLDTIKRLDDDAKSLVSGDAGGADAALVKNAEKLRTRLQALAETATGRIDQRKYLQKLSDAVGNRSSFRSQLGAYVKRFAGSKRANDFQRILDLGHALDDQIEKWNALTADFCKLDIQKVSPDSAASYLGMAGTLLDTWRNDPQSQLIRARLAGMEPIARRVSGGARIDAPLKDWFKLPWINGLKFLKTKRGNFYLEDEPSPFGDGGMRIFYVKDFKLATDSVLLKKDELIPAATVRESPQAVVGRKILDELRRVTDKNWEDKFCQMLLALEENEDLDPIPKSQLLWEILSVACKGSLVLEHAFANHLRQMQDSVPELTLVWLDPTDKPAQRARTAANDLLKHLPDFHAAQDAAAKEYAALRKPWAATRYRWVGWLLQGEDGHWKCASQPLSEDWSADLVLIGETTDQPPAVELAKVGRLEKGHATVGGTSSLLLEGRPVYAAFVEDKTK